MIEKIKFFLYIYENFFNTMHTCEAEFFGKNVRLCKMSVNEGNEVFNIRNTEFFSFHRVEFLR